MRTRVGLIALVLCLLFLALGPSLSAAQSGPAVLSSTVNVDFPARLVFNLSASSTAKITDVRLDYSVDQAGFARVISESVVAFTPATKIDVSYSLEMVKVGGLPPGTSLKYWWQVKDAGGNRIETKPVPVRFDDTRYQWRDLVEGVMTIHWYQGDKAFAGELMAAGQDALQRLKASTGASPDKAIEVYIYADVEALKGALIYPPEWIGGINYPVYHLIALAIDPSGLERGKRDMAHELTHQVMDQVTRNPYNAIPNWLNEGLATYSEGFLEPVLAGTLAGAVEDNSLISVRSLCSEFSAVTEQAYLSYAESYSLVEFLIVTYKQTKMLELLRTFRQGSTYDRALQKVYGFDMDGLNTLWRDYVTRQLQPSGQKTTRTQIVMAGAGSAG
jgi:hypothetical protein